MTEMQIRSSGLEPLVRLRKKNLMPKAGLIWIGLGFLPSKKNALAIDPARLPTDDDCKSVAGLDVILVVNGYATNYYPLRRLCSGLMAARPRRFQLVDLDYKRVAFLKLGGFQ
ncbi:hypothetical protein [Noviherbaspirillum autotrophicum]|uniref:Uncharacterized protein n=1 Tax=Noviherbaspirillum autotrophicum TaxID=709839 RepID=A0A0C2BTB0_9BURK|nr:hypothetical protein [Noviherbaspirillum autotrophicum]KIF81276.1 hypothetical protein TSA66_11295 [Noviherbaspirillum autotrophicum]